MTVTYEWDIETWDGDEVADHNHRDNLRNYFPGEVARAINDGKVFRLVLVRDACDASGCERSWAYVEGGKLPQYFEDAYGIETTPVPKRYREEFTR